MGIDDPDWGRYGVKPGRAFPPVGDPNRWGAVSVTPLTAAAAIDRRGDQFLRVQTNDPYSRSWSLIGTLALPVATWVAIDAGTVLVPRLEVRQGVGQTTVVQELNLIALTNLGHAAAFPFGLYLPTLEGSNPVYEGRAFAAIGALIGRALAFSMNYSHVAGIPGLPNNAIVNAIVTPYAAGTGL